MGTNPVANCATCAKGDYFCDVGNPRCMTSCSTCVDANTPTNNKTGPTLAASGVTVNNSGTAYAEGVTTAMVVDGADATGKFAVGDILYASAGHSLGVLTAVSALALTVGGTDGAHSANTSDNAELGDGKNFKYDTKTCAAWSAASCYLPDKENAFCTGNKSCGLANATGDAEICNVTNCPATPVDGADAASAGNITCAAVASGDCDGTAVASCASCATGAEFCDVGNPRCMASCDACRGAASKTNGAAASCAAETKATCFVRSLSAGFGKHFCDATKNCQPNCDGAEPSDLSPAGVAAPGIFAALFVAVAAALRM